MFVYYNCFGFSINASNILLFDKNIQKQFLDILDTNLVFLGETICPMATIYSLEGPHL